MYAAVWVQNIAKSVPVSYGEIVEVLDDSNAGWAKIKTSSGLEGYVSKRLSWRGRGKQCK